VWGGSGWGGLLGVMAGPGFAKWRQNEPFVLIVLENFVRRGKKILIGSHVFAVITWAG
jgi:hypothetical protein